MKLGSALQWWAKTSAHPLVPPIDVDFPMRRV
jgi:hypothetical protein